MTKTTKPLMYKGQPLTEERAEQIAEETLAELAEMSEEEREARTREPGTLSRTMTGQPGDQRGKRTSWT